MRYDKPLLDADNKNQEITVEDEAMEFDVEEEPKSPIDPNFDPDTETETESKSDVDEGDSQNVPRKK